jgi:SAM-dependent methyltransferase
VTGSSDPVADALTEVRTAGRPALEAGAGAGDATAALREGDARPVYAVTNDHGHAAGVRDRFADDTEVHTLAADLQAIPLPDDTVEVVTAHALFNLVPTTDAGQIVAELTRVTAPGGTVVVDDYGPVPDEETRALFGAGNTVAELVDGQPTYTFYPATHLRSLFEAAGWSHIETTTLLDPVPWTADLLDAHAEIASGRAGSLPDPLASALRDHIERVRRRAGEHSDTGRMYSVRLVLPDRA